MRTVTNYFIVNLSLADVLVTAICLPASLLVDITESWLFGHALCKVIPYLQVSFACCPSSPVTLSTKPQPHIALSDPQTCLSDRTQWLSTSVVSSSTVRKGKPGTGGHRHSPTYSHRDPHPWPGHTKTASAMCRHLQGHSTLWRREAQAHSDRQKCTMGLLPDPKGDSYEGAC